MRLSRLKRLPSRVKRAARFEIHAHWRRQPIVRGSVLYESFSGNGMLCNPEAIFRELLAAPDFGAPHPHLGAVGPRPVPRRRRGVRRRPAGTFVRYGSAAYYRALATSQYLVNNATFPPDFSKRAGQVYLNTWHGTPLKRMGYDIEDGALATANIVRNFVAADYLLAANPFMAEQMYETAYKLTGIYRGTLIEEGYPRIDRQFLDDAGRRERAAAADERGHPARRPQGDPLRADLEGRDVRRGPTDDIDELLAHIAADRGAHRHQPVRRAAEDAPERARPRRAPARAASGCWYPTRSRRTSCSARPTS